MGIVIRFPEERIRARSADAQPGAASATIIILPVIRTERHADTAPVVPTLLPSPLRPTRRRAAVQPAP